MLTEMVPVVRGVPTRHGADAWPVPRRNRRGIAPDSEEQSALARELRREARSGYVMDCVCIGHGKWMDWRLAMYKEGSREPKNWKRSEFKTGIRNIPT